MVVQEIVSDITVAPVLKRCAGPCGLELSLDSFGPKNRGRFGRKAQCKVCLAGTQSSRKIADPEGHLAYQQSWYELNKDRTRPTRISRARDTYQSRKQWRLENPAKAILHRVKYRAKRLGIPFSLTESDIVIPDVCPYLGIRLCPCTEKRGDKSPSLDRINSALGYVPGNVEVISDRANRIKNNGSAEEHEKIAKRMRTLGC